MPGPRGLSLAALPPVPGRHGCACVFVLDVAIFVCLGSHAVFVLDHVDGAAPAQVPKKKVGTAGAAVTATGARHPLDCSPFI